MTSYHINDKVYIKSSNKSSLIYARYTYTLIIYTVLSLIINFIIENDIIPFIKNISISVIFTFFITYLINLFKHKSNIKEALIDDGAIFIGLVLGLFPNQSLVILLIAIIITIAIKNIFPRFNLSSPIYGILIIIIYNHYFLNSDTIKIITDSLSFSEVLTNDGGIINYLFGLNYLSPLLAILGFVYLFYKKGIKYNIPIYYLLIVFIIYLIYGLVKGMFWLPFYILLTSGIIFLTICLLVDYRVTPTISEAEILYAVILAVITAILGFIIPELAIVVTMIFGMIFLVKPLDKLSYKLKYDRKINSISIIASIILVILTSVILIIVF